MFVPLGGWTHQEGGQSITRRNIAAGIFSARFDYALSSRLTLEGVVAVTPSQVAVSDPSETKDVTAGVVLGSAMALARVVSISYGGNHRGHASWDIFLGGGGAIMNRFGTAWDGWHGTTHPAAVLAIMTRSTMGGSVDLRFGIEDFLSRVRFDAGLPSETNATLRHEIVATLGFMVRIGDKR